MRRLLVLAAATLALLAPGVLADETTGQGTGAEVFGQSAGFWKRVDVVVPGTGPQAVRLTLSWETILLLRADFDLTLWKPTAFDDGVLRNDETLARAWSDSSFSPEVIDATLDGGKTYPVTIEPIHAHRHQWRLVSDGAGLQPVDQVILGTKVTR